MGERVFILYVFIAREGKGKVKIEEWVRHSTRSLLMTTWVLGKWGKKGYACTKALRGKCVKGD